ncbi:MAG: hypothetical protein ABSE42_19210 [Bryobacteraceae bacterium]|jgi:hypothetical protein
MATSKPKRTHKRPGPIRKAAKDVAREDEYARMREAYARQPDSAAEADDWSGAEEFRS